jgi:hypothetical protein
MEMSVPDGTKRKEPVMSVLYLSSYEPSRDLREVPNIQPEVP